MKNIILIAVLFIFNVKTEAQTKIELRNVKFTVPPEFSFVTGQDRKLDLDFFHETGKIFIDSLNIESLPKIYYQYYEFSKSGIRSSKEVLESINQSMLKDFKPDTLIIDDANDYSLAKYTINGISISELKTLGKKGWLNVQYFETSEEITKNLETPNLILKSIQHVGKFESDYEKHVNEGAESSKWAMIFGAITLMIYLIQKLIKKTLPNNQ